MSRASDLDLFCRGSAHIPRLSLGAFPTPVHRVDLEGVRFWVKDDSACSPIYGGNKVRKLEYLFADCRARNVRGLVVWGDTDSHTVAATAILGRREGFDVHAVVFSYRDSSASSTIAAIDFLTRSGVRVHRVRNMLIAWLAARWLSRTRHTFLVPLGGTNALACVGYVTAAIELAEQIASGVCPCPDQLYVALGTGGTVAGLLLGLAIADLPTNVVAVRTVDRIVTPASTIPRLIAQLVRMFSLPMHLIGSAMSRLERIDDRQLGKGYRDVPPASSQAVALAGTAGLCLEPIFTGKVLACLLNDVAHSPATLRMFWNTHDRLTSIARQM